MTVDELMNKLNSVDDKDRAIIFVDRDGGWTNLDFIIPSDIYKCSQVILTPSDNRDK